MTEVIYFFLNSSFGQSIAIPKIVDFNVFDVVTILLVDLAGDGLVGVDGRRPDDWRSKGLQDNVSTKQSLCDRETYRANRRHIDMLDALLRLNLRVDPRSRRRRRSCCLVFYANVCRAVCGLTSYGAAFTMRLRVSPRRRSRATICIETRAHRAFRLVAVEARS